jgi:hypothetical protein
MRIEVFQFNFMENDLFTIISNCKHNKEMIFVFIFSYKQKQIGVERFVHDGFISNSQERIKTAKIMRQF